MREEKAVLNLREFMPPDCSCRIEDRVKKDNPYVIDVEVNPVDGLIQATFDGEKTGVAEIEAILKRCGYKCEHRKHKHGDAHEDHHAKMERDMKRRFWVMLVVTIPVLILSPTIQDWFGFEVTFSGSKYVLFALATLIAAYGGRPFFRGAYKSLKSGVLDMMVLVSLAVLTGYFFSVGGTFFFEAADFYWEISTLILALLFGHWWEMRAVRGASGALRELVKLIPPTANRIENGDVREVPTAEVEIDDLLLIRPGDKVPIDGIVVDGETTVSEAMITGESKPIHKGTDDEVVGGTINGDGSIKIRVTKVGEETALSQIIELVKAAQSSKPRTQRIADRAAHYLTLTAIIVGVGTFAYWTGIAGAGSLFALTLAITVVVIACPHALGLAIPIVTSISTNLAARNGVLIKNANALETARRIDAIVFDKTGTLTRGEFGVTDVVNTGDWTEEHILMTAASIEVGSEHVIARGIVQKAKQQGIDLETVKHFTAIPGKGAKAAIADEEIFIGNRRLMEELGVSFDGFDPTITQLSSQGKTVVYLAADGEVHGVIALADIIRKESRQAVEALKQLGVEVAMLTGDNCQTAAYVAEELGLDTFFAEVLPEDKAGKVESLQRDGKTVAMVGDGINDAPALVQADVGIAIGAGTDVAVESADVVLVKNDPRDVVKLIRLSRETRSKMGQNLAWATGYNVIAIPAAAGVLSPVGVVLRPEWAALIMASSSIIVVANALLLKRAKL
ncbi:MAG: heavy metal translocating P-type ATPase [Candidatus Bipolaricaulia bacterium]